MKKTKGGAKKRRKKGKQKSYEQHEPKNKKNIIKLVETESNANGYLRCPCSTLQKEGQKCN